MDGMSSALAIENPAGTFQPASSTQVDRDDELLAALRRRDRTAAECLVARYGARAYRLAVGIARNAQDAEEVVQDALWSVVRKIETFRGESTFSGWVYRIVANAAYQKLRARGRRAGEISLAEVLPSFREDGRHATPVADWSRSLEDPSRQAELRTGLAAAIDELPPQYRAVLVLHDVEGLSSVEVAETLTLGVHAVKSRVHRARLFLRRRLGDTMATRPVTVPLDDRNPGRGGRPAPDPRGETRRRHMGADTQSKPDGGGATMARPTVVPAAGGVVGGLPECRLRRVTRYIQDHPHEELRLMQLSALVNMSPYHFARLFKRSTGASPHRFLVRRRVEQAAALLVAQALPIAEIARSVGFRTPSHFATTFRRAIGVTPSLYRSRQRS